MSTPSKKEEFSKEISEEVISEKVDGKITGKVIREFVEKINKSLLNRKLRAVRNLDDTISIDIVGNNVVEVLEDSGMSPREAFYFLKGVEINLKINGETSNAE